MTQYRKANISKKGIHIWTPFLLKPMLCYEARLMLSPTRRAHIQQRGEVTNFQGTSWNQCAL